MRAFVTGLTCITFVFVGGSPLQAHDVDKPAAAKALAVAAAFIDDFYSFNPVRLRAAMANASGSTGDIVYYQGWAKAGNYVVLRRKPCHLDKPDEVSCGVTVKDDLAPALKISYHVTDVFHLAFRDGRIVKVWNSSDDPPEFDEAMKWLHRTRPGVFTGPCRGMWKGGPTPGDCVRTIVAGFADYTAGHSHSNRKRP